MDEVNLFVAYAPEDEKLKNQLSKHLVTLKDEGYINEWSASEILAGSGVDQSLRRQISRAQIIMLLVSSDFLSNESCKRTEDLAFAAKAKNNAIIVPVILRPCLYDEGFNQLKILPDGIHPVTDTDYWGSIDAAFTNIAKGIKKLVESIRHSTKHGSPPPVQPHRPPEVKKTIEKTVPGPASSPKLVRNILFGLLALILLSAVVFVARKQLMKKGNTGEVAQTATAVADRYDEYIKEASASYKKGNYPVAMHFIDKALEERPGKAEALRMKTSIQKKLDGLSATERNAAASKEYTDAITKADKLFANKEYRAAMEAYSLASGLKPSDPYPKEKIQELEKLLAETGDESTDEKYKSAINRGDYYYKQKAYEKASSYYYEALKVKPRDSYATRQIMNIKKLLSK